MAQPVSSIPATGNRVLDAVLFFAQQEAEYRVKNPLIRNNDAVSLGHLKKQYEHVIAGFQDGRRLTRDERKTVTYLRHKVRQLNAQLQPNLLRAIVYARPVNRLLNKALGRWNNIAHFDTIVTSHAKEQAMVHNIHHIHASMYRAGFTGQIEQALKKMIDDNLPAFSIRHVQPDALKADFLLHFVKFPDTDVYYFKQYDVTTRPDMNSLIAKEAGMASLSFSPHDKVVFAAQQAANLVNGHPIHNEVNGQSVWYAYTPSDPSGLMQKTFDLEKALANANIKELSNPSQKKKLLAALQSGHTAAATIVLPGGRDEPLLVKVSPSLDKITFANAVGQYVDPHALAHQQAQAIRIAQQTAQKRTPSKQKTQRAL